jgi:hypothetical protein
MVGLGLLKVKHGCQRNALTESKNLREGEAITEPFKCAVSVILRDIDCRFA